MKLPNKPDDKDENMKKNLVWLTFLLFAVIPSVQSQTIDKGQYTSIDPFDYRLNEEKAASGEVRKFRSVVRFGGQNGQTLTFNSLEEDTVLELKAGRGQLTLPSINNVATIYFTATKRGVDALVLDFVDTSNTTEAGIGVVKSNVATTKVKDSDYTEIAVFDYRIEAELAQMNEVRKYRSTVIFANQNGITYSFLCPEDNSPLSFRVSKRYPLLVQGQRVVVYFTATKGIVDTLTLDHIEATTGTLRRIN